jgi:hypothetical protein
MSETFGNLLGQVILVIIMTGIFGLVLAFILGLCISDARSRGKSPLLVSIACILFFPWGTIAWLIFRPDPKDDPGSRSPFHLEDHRLQ